MKNGTTQNRPPLVGVSSCTKDVGGHESSATPLKYIRAVHDIAKAVPVMIPTLGAAMDVDALLDHLDGILLTGSVSNIHPSHYGGTEEDSVPPHDKNRDDLTLRLIRSALARGVAICAICRGFQELNVALGGTLHPALHKVGNALDHRRDSSKPLMEQYNPAHPVEFAENGLLHRITGLRTYNANSAHEQGINTLAPRLALDAWAPDGCPEAITCPDAPGFVLGVQWHPEAMPFDDPVTHAIFTSFGDAAREHAAKSDTRCTGSNV